MPIEIVVHFTDGTTREFDRADNDAGAGIRDILAILTPHEASEIAEIEVGR